MCIRDRVRDAIKDFVQKNKKEMHSSKVLFVDSIEKPDGVFKIAKEEVKVTLK